jgi:hypothetical protein
MSINPYIVLTLLMVTCVVVWSVSYEIIKLEKINLILLFFTLAFVCLTALDTNRIANQTVENSLRPIILRGGVLIWDEILSRGGNNNFVPPMLLNSYNNLAQDVRGHIIIDHKKYELLFTNEMAVEPTSKDGVNGRITRIFQKWSWLPPNSSLYATFDKTKFESTSDKNEMLITYKDVEGNQYFSKEDAENNQISKKI